MRSALVFLGIVFTFLLLAQSAEAQNAAIRLDAFPSVALADGHSAISLTVEVRTSNGSRVPDGTRVVLSSSLGSIRDNVVTTVNGVARTTLTSSSIPGTAKVTANAVGYNANSILEVEFVQNRELLSSAKEYVEIVGKGYVVYSPEKRIVGAAAKQERIHLRYRDIDLEADDLQLNVAANEVRARNADLHFGSASGRYSELYLKLSQRRGLGVTSFESTTNQYRAQPPFIWTEPVKRMKVGVVEIKASGIVEQPGFIAPEYFKFADLNESITLIQAKKIVAYPLREIQFQNANLIVGGVSVMRLPLFLLNSQMSKPVITDQFLSVSNNQIAIDYPYYLSLKPGLTSALRLRSGTRYSSGGGAASGTFLDYEINWNKGADLDGGITFMGLARKDWGISARQYIRFDDNTSASAQLDFPANRSLLGSISVNRQLGSYQAAIHANSTNNVRGLPYRSHQVDVILEREPLRPKGAPFTVTYGLSASTSSFKTDTLARSQNRIGFRTRVQANPMAIAKGTTVNSAMTFEAMNGHNARNGISMSGIATLSTRVFGSTSLVVGYEYLNDGYNSTILGQHRITGSTYFDQGNASLFFYGAKSLDIDRFNFQGEFSYRLNRQWRLAGTYSMDRFQGSNYTNSNVVLGYRIGFREVGLSWSSRTKRIGLEFLGTTIP